MTPADEKSPACETPNAQGESRLLGLPPLGLIAAGLTLLGLTWLVVALGHMALDRTATNAAGAANLALLWPYWISSGIAWAGLTMLWVALRRDGKAHRHGVAIQPNGLKKTANAHRPRATPGPRFLPLVVVFSVAMAARATVIITHNATLSDDIYRYELDGRTFAHGINPYLQSPDQRRSEIITGFPERWPGELQLLARVNNPDMHTVYLPTSQLVFAGVGAALGDARLDPDDSARAYRTTFVLFELLAMACIALLLCQRNRSPWWLALYAWHPVAIAEFAGSGHQDAIGIALLAMALLIVDRHASSSRRVMLSMVPLAIAALVKPVTIPIGVLALRHRRPMQWLVSGLIGAVICCILAGPMLLSHDAQPLENLRTSVDRFSNKWAHFSSVYEPVLAVSRIISPIDDDQIQWQKKEQHELIARLVCLAILAGVFIGIWRSKMDLIAATRALLFAMVLLSTAAHPWYVLWALLLVPVAPSAALWIASFTLTLGYAALARPATWDIAVWVSVIAYAPIYAALVVQLIRTRICDRTAPVSSPG